MATQRGTVAPVPLAAYGDFVRAELAAGRSIRDTPTLASREVVDAALGLQTATILANEAADALDRHLRLPVGTRKGLRLSIDKLGKIRELLQSKEARETSSSMDAPETRASSGSRQYGEMHVQRVGLDNAHAQFTKVWTGAIAKNQAGQSFVKWIENHPDAPRRRKKRTQKHPPASPPIVLSPAVWADPDRRVVTPPAEAPISPPTVLVEMPGPPRTSVYGCTNTISIPPIAPVVEPPPTRDGPEPMDLASTDTAVPMEVETEGRQLTGLKRPRDHADDADEAARPTKAASPEANADEAEVWAWHRATCEYVASGELVCRRLGGTNKFRHTRPTRHPTAANAAKQRPITPDDMVVTHVRTRHGPMIRRATAPKGVGTGTSIDRRKSLRTPAVEAAYNSLGFDDTERALVDAMSGFMRGAYIVLRAKSSGQPMSTRDLTNVMFAEFPGLVETQGKTPVNTMSATLTSHRNATNNTGIIRCVYPPTGPVEWTLAPDGLTTRADQGDDLFRP